MQRFVEGYLLHSTDKSGKVASEKEHGAAEGPPADGVLENPPEACLLDYSIFN